MEGLDREVTVSSYIPEATEQTTQTEQVSQVMTQPCSFLLEVADPVDVAIYKTVEPGVHLSLHSQFPEVPEVQAEADHQQMTVTQEQPDRSRNYTEVQAAVVVKESILAVAVHVQQVPEVPEVHTAAVAAAAVAALVKVLEALQQAAPEVQAEQEPQ